LQNNLNDPEINIDYEINTTRIRIFKTFAIDNQEKLTDPEKFIMSFARRKSNFSINDIVKDPQNHFGKQTTIRKYVNSLVEKHLLSNEKIGKKYIYNLQKNNDYLNRVKHLKHLEDNLLK